MADYKPSGDVELTIQCRNLKNKDFASKSDPMCVVSVRQAAQDNWVEVGRTESIKNSLNPEFSKKFSMKFYFEQKQMLRFEIYDLDSNTADLKKHDFLGRAEMSLGELMSAPGSKIHQCLTGIKNSKGSIIVSAEETGSANESAYLIFHGQGLDNKDTFGKSDPFFLIYRRNSDESRTLAYRSKTIKNNLSPAWNEFNVQVRALCDYDTTRPFDVEVYDEDNNGKHDLIGVCQLTVEGMKTGTQTKQPLLNPKKASKKNYKNSGLLLIKKCEIKIQHSFLDYIRGGTQVHFTVAVDFTASNGNPAEANSLHYMHPHIPNQYGLALKAVGDIIQDYDADKRFPALGFGARLPNGQVSHEFYLNGHPTDPTCYGVDGVLQAYRQAIMKYQLYGPTNFAPVIYHVSKFAQAAAKVGDGSHYFVLLIITDGVISDLEATKAAIVNASTLPMSIIVIGVGAEDFSPMNILDSDKSLLKDNQGHVAERDIVQFVPIRDFLASNISWEQQQARLAQAVLAEVPDQLTAYMLKRNIPPRPPQQISNVPITNPTNPAPTPQLPLQPTMTDQTAPGNVPAFSTIPGQQQNIGQPGQFPGQPLPYSGQEGLSGGTNLYPGQNLYPTHQQYPPQMDPQYHGYMNQEQSYLGPQNGQQAYNAGNALPNNGQPNQNPSLHGGHHQAQPYLGQQAYTVNQEPYPTQAPYPGFLSGNTAIYNQPGPPVPGKEENLNDQLINMNIGEKCNIINPTS